MNIQPDDVHSLTDFKRHTDAHIKKLARSGRPSLEKNSSDSSSDSMIPSNWNDPQMKRTAGGTIFLPSSCGVMK